MPAASTRSNVRPRRGASIGELRKARLMTRASMPARAAARLSGLVTSACRYSSWGVPPAVPLAPAVEPAPLPTGRAARVGTRPMRQDHDAVSARGQFSGDRPADEAGSAGHPHDSRLRPHRMPPALCRLPGRDTPPYSAYAPSREPAPRRRFGVDAAPARSTDHEPVSSRVRFPIGRATPGGRPSAE